MRNAQGFSVIELMMSTALMTVVMAGVYGSFVAGNSIYVRDVVLSDVHQQTNEALDRLSRELRESESSTLTAVNTSEDEIIFDTPDKQRIRYYVRQGILYRLFNGQTHVIARNIVRFKLRRDGSKMHISIQASKSYRGRTKNFFTTQYVRLRNE